MNLVLPGRSNQSRWRGGTGKLDVLIEVVVFFHARPMGSNKIDIESLEEHRLRLPRLRTVRAPIACVQRPLPQAWHRSSRSGSWRRAPAAAQARPLSADLIFAAKVNFFMPCRAGSLIPNGRSRPRTWLPSARLTRTNRS